VERFFGSYEYSLDAKGRIILPARLRSQFDTKRAIVSCYVDKCLAVWTDDEFNRHLSRAEAMEWRGTEGRNIARTLSALSAEVEIDAQWRLTIPATLRGYALLEADKPVMVIGARNRIELWNADLWRESLAPSLERLANGTSALFSDQPALDQPARGGPLAGTVGAP
jgi:MraZ protein